MTPSEINVKIAELCGLIVLDDPKWSRSYKPFIGSWKTEPFGSQLPPHYGATPQYFSDLNAMHEAEMSLTDDEMWPKYYDELCQQFDYDMTMLIRATAPQRCEAFLRVKGAWKE